MEDNNNNPLKSVGEMMQAVQAAREATIKGDMTVDVSNAIARHDANWSRLAETSIKAYRMRRHAKGSDTDEIRTIVGEGPRLLTSRRKSKRGRKPGVRRARS